MFFCLATAFQLGARTQVTHTHSTPTRDPAAEGVGAEHLSIRGTAEDMVAEGPAIGTPYGLRCRIACDARWRAREAVLSLAGGERSRTCAPMARATGRTVGGR